VTEDLLSIGEFARRSRLSLKALRLYDRSGLLTPAEVEPDNGRRRYHRDQLRTARMIVLLRRLDMPLAQIAAVVTAPGPEAARLVAAYWDDVEQQVVARRELATRVRIGLAGGDASVRVPQVLHRTVPEQVVLTEQRHVHGSELIWVRSAAARLTRAAELLGGTAGPRLVVFHGEVNEDSDGPVEVCVPVAGAPVNPAGPAWRMEPAHREAYAPVTWAQFEVPQILSVYDAVEHWITTQGLVRAGPPREVYRTEPDAAGPGDVVCEVAFPIR
jgi:DNA-binding transcriptional MerR regulator